MGRRAEFSDQQIIEAGKAITAEGKLVSPFAIRNRLQGGSSERIKIVWSEYLSQQESIVEEKVEEIELPTEIAEKLEKNQQTAINQLEKLAMESYKVAQQVAEKRVKSTIDDYQSKILEYEESENQASLAIESSDNKIDELEAEIDVLQSRNEELVAENSRLLGLLEANESRIKQLEIKEVEFDKLQRAYGKLEGRFELLSK
ncbi:DNA-binding protein [Paraglaciecola aquimarina]|uniref:DNA-binding protein n=1 Tax=Paraglaciecola algarum TaxID=3050085 RepID=A0ABS9D8W2_9ALTE|nr:DNA-binding protein [Paraglaciecola sp. G1-23]MCF2948827.1 DNA-binding protein [Paraglaciecola sp. G1-23]MDN4504095.1 DNA-binding protein [Alteromonadaceae bacterium BrNp21-10]